MIDESQRAFTPAERRIAELLESEGKDVIALPEDPATPGRLADALVDNVRTELKSPIAGANSQRLKNAVSKSLKGGGQARNIIIDGRATGLTVAEANRTFARVRGITKGNLDSLRIIGDDFDITATGFP